jgi:serine/threonine protein kinase/tetratricopeptide (TPR) repeat protein
LAETTGDFSRVCAVKRIHRELAALDDFATRFQQDARLLVRLIHGGLVQVLEVGSVLEQPFIAMELLDGVSLSDLVQSGSEKPLPVEAALYIALEYAEAIDYVRQKRLEQHYGQLSGPSIKDGELATRKRPSGKHKTLSDELPTDRAWALEPMVAFDGVVKLVDLGSFGALRLRQQAVSRLMRSPGYAPPEVIKSETLTSRSDVFSVGLLAWELLSGQTLISGSPDVYVKQVVGGAWKAPLISRQDVPGNVIRRIAEMLDADPKKRPDTLEDARAPFVAGLRRLSPNFGANALSELLGERFADRFGQLDDMIKTARRYAPTKATSQPAGSETLTFGLAKTADRVVSAPVALAAGDRVPGTRYRVVRLLGRGGSAEVFAVQHIDLERMAAMKILNSDLAAQSASIAQFRMEARACSKIGHPNIVEILDFGELPDGRFFFTMELIEGESLADELARDPTIAVERSMAIVRQAARALSAAHAQRVVHRDVKPENLMLTARDGRPDFVKVLDFGVMAFATDSDAERGGTPGYMSPEQVAGHTASPRMDIYALGAMLYELFCGTLPYPGETLQKFVAQQRAGDPPPMNSHPSALPVHPAIERVILRALSRDPAQRQQDCAELEKELILAQREAGIVTVWDDLSLPEGMEADKPKTPAETAEIGRVDVVDRPEKSRGPMMAAGIAVGLAVVGLAYALLTSNTQKGADSGDTKGTVATKAPKADARVKSDAMPAGVLALLKAAEQAAGRGHFTQPAQKSAYDKLLSLEALPGTKALGKRLRTRWANQLIGLAGRLERAGLLASACTLAREALVFVADDARAQRLCKTKAAAAAGKTRPEQRLAKIAHLVVAVEDAVADGRWLRPVRHNALHYLYQLKKLDPKGQYTEKLQKRMLAPLRAKADGLWNAGKHSQAQRLYKSISELDASDKLAKKRATLPPPKVLIVKNPPGKVPPTKKAPTKKPDDAAAKKLAAAARQKARELVAEGKKKLSTGALPEARRLFKQARAAHASSPGAALGLARVAFASADYSTAITEARAALRAAPGKLRAHLLLGDAFYALHRKADAKQAWQRGLKLDPENKGLKKRLSRVTP